MTVTEFIDSFDLDLTKPVFFDIETEELYYNTSLIQFRQNNKSYLVRTDSEEDVESLNVLIQDMHVVGYNLSYDFGTLDVVPKKIDDLFAAVKIAYPQFQEYSLDKVISKLGFDYLYEGLDKKTLQKKGFIRKSYLSNQQLKYAEADVIACELMWELPKIKEVIKNNLAYRLAIYALEEAIVWQDNGLPLLSKTVDKYIADAKARDADYSSKIYELTGQDINPRSAKQVKEYFGTGSSDKATMTRIAIEGHLSKAGDVSNHKGGRIKARDAQDFTPIQQQVAEQILGARKARNDLSKLQNFVGQEKMFGRFKPIGTSTSRWACSGTPKGSSRPELFNAQNYSRDYKSVFGVEPDSGMIIVAADYATLEIRIAACMMQEENMYKALMAGEDIHKSTASLLFNKPIDEVHGKERSNAKVANFGLTYGMGRETFKHYAYDMYGIKFTDEEAADLIGRFFKAYPGLKAYHNMVGSKMRKHNYICKTALGYPMKPKMYAEAINGPTQGTGGECMRLAIHLLIKKNVDAYKYIVNSIHDALYLIVPEKDKEYWGKLLSDSMQEAWYEIRKSAEFKWHDVPMPVDVMYGYNMGELEEDFAGGGQALSIEEMRQQKERNKSA